jgi:hydroxymethylglutaryl-CoA lyase
VGFDTIDVGSFVSPRAIPQMRDTAEVIRHLRTDGTSSSLLTIVANTRGAEEACRYNQIRYLGFPLSVSETFQRRNTHQTMVQAINTLHEIQELCKDSPRSLVVYLSMAFGNPYGDPYDADRVLKMVDILATLEVRVVSLADTTGVSVPTQIHNLFTTVSSKFPSVELGAHLHSTASTAREKIGAAYGAGCRRFDGALKGYGGCPMAEDELVGNLATEAILDYLDERRAAPPLNRDAVRIALAMTDQVFP